jgi:hypothetical protein
MAPASKNIEFIVISFKIQELVRAGNHEEARNFLDELCRREPPEVLRQTCHTRIILVYLDAGPYLESRLSVAVALAHQHGATLTGVDISTDAVFESEWQP